jgi:hypothetical protein
VERLQVKSDGILPMSPFYFTASWASMLLSTARAPNVYLLNGRLLKSAQQIAAHESARTTKLYNRRNDQLTLDQV